MKRSIALLLLLAALLALTAGCGGKVSYREDLSAEKLAGIMDKHLSASQMAVMTSGYLSGAMKMDPTLFSDYVVKVTAYGTKIDEYGVFRVPSADRAEAAKDAVESYLQLRKDNWMEEYLPEEKPKLTNAAVKCCGLYVLYVIVSDEVRQPMLDGFENALKQS